MAIFCGRQQVVQNKATSIVTYIYDPRGSPNLCGKSLELSSEYLLHFSHSQLQNREVRTLRLLNVQAGACKLVEP